MMVPASVKRIAVLLTGVLEPGRKRGPMVICRSPCILFASHLRQVGGRQDPSCLMLPSPTILVLCTLASSILEPSLKKKKKVGWAPQEPCGQGLFAERSAQVGEFLPKGAWEVVLSDGRHVFSLAELSQLKPLKVILHLILCGRSHASLRETSDFHL